MATNDSPLVGVIMGSDSDLPVMQGAVDVLGDFGIAHEVRVVSAHRTPDVMYDYARTAAARQMPDGIPVATVGVGKARNAGLLAVRILGAHDEALRAQLDQHRAALDATVREKDAALSKDRLSRG